MTRQRAPRLVADLAAAGRHARVYLSRTRARWRALHGYRRAGLILLLTLIALEGADLFWPPPLWKLAETSAVVVDRRGATLRVFPVTGGKWRLKADVGAIDPKFISALLAYEDKRFRAHGGVDVLALGRAVGAVASTGHIVSGGSTLTMQLARLLEPRPRTMVSKAVQVIRAWQIERRLSKDQILEAYLTLAPYGGNLEGVRAASLAYFGRDATDLSADQIALLIALPQSPEQRRPDRHPDGAVNARARVLRRLADARIVAAALADESRGYAAPTRRPFPAMAWHAAEEARAREAGGDAPARRGIATTIDLALQKELETLAERGRQGDVQVAMMAVDITTREVRAAVGSATRTAPGGWLDLTNRPRSPGSTLKPFIYGLAFDDGVATEATRINDAPRRFGTYRPEDFDRVFHGEVTIAEALQHSLNVPAVAALDKVGTRRFAAALSLAGADLALPLDAVDDVGLPIALGGVGLRLRDLAGLYAALGDEGRARPLVWLQSERPANVASERMTRILSAESAREIVQILAGGPAPAGRMPARLTRQAPEIAFKTGTSYGYRDAWAAGISGGHVVVVWTGRADGAPRPGVTGRDAALPLLFDAFDAIARILPNDGSGPDVRTADDHAAAPPPLDKFAEPNAAPHILFPPDGAEVWWDADHRDFVLTAEAQGSLRWYAEGEPITANTAGESVWRPATPGFYALTAVDSNGRSARTHVRIKAVDDHVVR